MKMITEMIIIIFYYHVGKMVTPVQ